MRALSSWPGRVDVLHRYERDAVAESTRNGGTAPYRLSVKGLPAPLRVRGDGTILGKPKAPGTYSLGVDVVDAAGIRNGAIVALKVVRR